MRQLRYCLRWAFKPRALVWLRRDCPALLVVPMFVLGQGTPWSLALYFSAALSITVLLKRISAATALAGLMGLLTTYQFAPPQPPIGLHSYIVEVIDLRYPTVGLYKIEARLRGIIDDQQILPLRGLITCHGVHLPWRNGAVLNVGDTVVIRASLTPLPSSSNPFSYDSHAARRGVIGECNLLAVSATDELAPASLESLIRSHIHETISSASNSAEQSGLLLSMAFGFRDQVSERLEHVYKDVGLAHLLVLSGFQISLVAISVRWIFLRFTPWIKRYFLRPDLLASGLSLLVTLWFVHLTGMDAPSVRAACAVALMLGGILCGSVRSIAQTLALSFLMVCSIWPCGWAEPSVELTYAALIGLTTATAHHTGWRSLESCLRASLFTSIVCVIWFNTVSWLGFILNPVFAPVLSVLSCYGGFSAALVAAFWPWAGKVIASVSIWGIGLCNSIIEWLAYLVPATTLKTPVGMAAMLVGQSGLAGWLILATWAKYLRQNGVQLGAKPVDFA